MADITVDRCWFRRILVPTYNEFMMSQEKAFDVHAESVISELQEMYNCIFPYDPQRISEDSAIKFIVSSLFKNVSFELS